jgi:hypothetical protein
MAGSAELCDHGSRAASGDDDALTAQLVIRVQDRVPRDADRSRELAAGGQPHPGAQFARGDSVTDRNEDLIRERARPRAIEIEDVDHASGRRLSRLPPEHAR